MDLYPFHSFIYFLDSLLYHLLNKMPVTHSSEPRRRTRAMIAQNPNSSVHNLNLWGELQMNTALQPKRTSVTQAQTSTTSWTPQVTNTTQCHQEMPRNHTSSPARQSVQLGDLTVNNTNPFLQDLIAAREKSISLIVTDQMQHSTTQWDSP